MNDHTPSLRNLIVLLASTIALAGGLISCSDEPTQQNAIISPVALKTYLFHDTTVFADTDVTFRRFIPMNSSVNLLGRSGGYTAIALIQFTPAYLPIRDTAAVYSAVLRLKTLTWFGDSTGTWSFNVYLIKTSWNSSTLTWDTLNTAGFYDQSIVRGSYTGGAASDSQRVSIPLDTAMVREWISTLPASGDTKYGIILIPTISSGIVRGFSQYSTDTSLAPTLDIIAGSPTGPQRDTASYNVTMSSFAGNIDNLASDPTRLYVQSGVVFRCALHFNLAFIPKGAMINKAEMLLNQNTATSRLNRFSGTPAVVAHLMTSATDTTIFDIYNAPTSSIKSGTTATHSFDARYLVQTWVKGPNYGVLVAATSWLDYLSSRDSEHTSFDLYTFFSHRATDPTQRPRIHIIYALGN